MNDFHWSSTVPTQKEMSFLITLFLETPSTFNSFSFIFRKLLNKEIYVPRMAIKTNINFELFPHSLILTIYAVQQCQDTRWISDLDYCPSWINLNPNFLGVRNTQMCHSLNFENIGKQFNCRGARNLS